MILWWVIGCVALALLCGDLMLGNALFAAVLDPKHKLPRVLRRAMKGSSPRADPVWLEQTAPKERSIESRDGLKLHALAVEQNPDKWVILCHGYHDDCRSMSANAEMFNSMGYSVLLPDARGSGGSEGNYVGLGWLERRDLIAWIGDLGRRYHTPQVVLFGQSMGAATVLYAAGEPDLPRNVRAVIEDCGYSSIRAELSWCLRKYMRLPASLTLPAMSFACRLRAGYSLLRDGGTVAAVRRARTPILFIHGAQDRLVPPHMQRELYDAAHCEKQQLLVEGADHMSASQLDPLNYWDTIRSFLGRYITK